MSQAYQMQPFLHLALFKESSPLPSQQPSQSLVFLQQLPAEVPPPHPWQGGLLQGSQCVLDTQLPLTQSWQASQGGSQVASHVWASRILPRPAQRMNASVPANNNVRGPRLEDTVFMNSLGVQMLLDIHVRRFV